VNVWEKAGVRGIEGEKCAFERERGRRKEKQ
jgi:hypothetical protein